MILGIDLGTTNSLASVLIDGKLEFVEFEGSPLLPSIVTFLDDNDLLVGQKAKNRYILDPHNSVKSIKRMMGSDTKTIIRGKGYLPEEISALILGYIKKCSETQFQTKFTQVIITVPAYFSDQQRKATAIAGKIAGFEVKRIINEPTAASLAYNVDHKDEITAVVYDLGGGTFDVSIVNISHNIVEVLSSCGNNHLGGDDFDQDLAKLIIERIEIKEELKLDENTMAKHQIQTIAEKCKIELSDNPFCKIIEIIELDNGKPPLKVELEISRTDFEGIIRPYIDETIDLVQQALNDAKLSARDIDQIMLVGGSSKIPLITDEFKAVFEVTPMGNINPDLCVCVGAAVQGSIINNEKIDSILVDVTPFTFGTRAVRSDYLGFYEDDDIFIPLIHKNTPLPVGKSDVFYKVHPEQKTIAIEIYQGEEEKASQNSLIGKFNVQDLSQQEGSEEIILTMNLDLNGILTVIATEKKTGKRKQISIDNSFEERDIAESFELLSGYLNTEDEEGVSKQESALEEDNQSDANKIYIAQTMMEKARGKMDLASDEDSIEMKNIIERLEGEIASKNITRIEELTEELTDILFYID